MLIQRRSPEARALERENLLKAYTGAAAAVKPIPAKEAGSFRVASFNVHGLNDFRQRPWESSPSEAAAILEQIKAVNPDILCLQEMVYTDADALGKACDALGIPPDDREQHLVYAKGCIWVQGYENSVSEANADVNTGNVIISKYPLREQVGVRLYYGKEHNEKATEDKGEERSMVSAIAATPMGDIKVASTHLQVADPTGMVRRRQARQVCEHMESGGLPWMVMADTNGDYGKGLTPEQ